MRLPHPDPPAPRPTAPPPLPLHLRRRQDQPLDCSDVDNSVYSCFPTPGFNAIQNTSVHFVWNARHPLFAGAGVVDVYLFHEDTLLEATSHLHLENVAGRTAFNVNDTWFGAPGLQFDGHNRSFPFFFKVLPGGQDPNLFSPQATFNAIQTRVLDSVLASSIAAAAAASSSSVAAASSSSAAAESSRTLNGSGAGPTSTTMGGGSIQNNSDGSSFPGWAIAVIVILSVLAILAFLLVFFFVVRVRRRRSERQRPASVGSSTPIMAETRAANLPSPHDAATTQPLLGLDRARSIAGSTHTRDPDAPFSGADAEIMAAAFRDTLRKPDFASRPVEEGESPEVEVDDRKLERELAEEGRDLRSVSSSKVRVLGDESEAGTIRGGRPNSYDSPSVDSG